MAFLCLRGGEYLERIKPICRSPPLYLSSLVDEVRMNEKHVASTTERREPTLPYVRRTISIAPKINKWIQDFRAKSMQDDPTIEHDYTTVSNYLMAWGIIFTQKYESDQKDSDEVAALAGDRLQLETLSIRDSYENLFLKKRLEPPPRSSNSNSVKGKKKAGTPELEKSP